MPYRDNIAYSEVDTSQLRLAWGIAIVVLVLSLGAVQFANVPLGEFEAFAPALGTVDVFAQVLTAVLLFGQYRTSHYAPLGALTLAYVGLVFLDAAHLLAIPHFLTSRGFAGGQTASWLYFNTRAAFLSMLVIYGFLDRAASQARAAYQQQIVAVLAIVGACYVVAAVLIGIRDPALLHVAMSPGGFSLPWQPLVTTCVVLMNVVALILAISLAQLRRSVHVWLAVALVAMLCETYLTNSIADTRYSLGWFVSRLDWLVASSVVLLVLLSNTGRVLRELTARYDLFNEASSMDVLTGLLNREGFTFQLEEELRRMQRSGDQLSLLMIDVDDFKHYNDELGSAAGDSLLAAIADVMRMMLGRPRDCGSRVGSDEYAVLLPETDEPGAIAVAERIRRGIERKGMVQGKGARLPVVTVSIGVASTDDYPTHDGNELCMRAEAALYGAKAAGRNCVRVQGAFRGASAETRFAG